jgi:hypothetical protein
MAQSNEPEVVIALRRARTELRAMLATLFAVWQDQGLLRTDVAPDHMADLALGLTFVSAWDLTIDPDDAPEQIRTLLAATVTLLRPASRNGASRV